MKRTLTSIVAVAGVLAIAEGAAVPAWSVLLIVAGMLYLAFTQAH